MATTGVCVCVCVCVCVRVCVCDFLPCTLKLRDEYPASSSPKTATDGKKETYGTSFEELNKVKKIKEASDKSRWDTFDKDDHPLKIMVNTHSHTNGLQLHRATHTPSHTHTHTQTNHNRTELLTHPVVGSLIHHKWIKFGVWWYFFNLFTFSVYLTFLTSFTLLLPNPQSDYCEYMTCCINSVKYFTVHIIGMSVFNATAQGVYMCQCVFNMHTCRCAISDYILSEAICVSVCSTCIHVDVLSVATYFQRLYVSVCVQHAYM